MLIRSILIATVAAATVGQAGCYSDPSSPEQMVEHRAELRSMADDTLNRLYGLQPSARSVVQNAYGYAVFSTFGLKILVTGGGSGAGVAVNNQTLRNTYMRMVQLQAGWGMGISETRLVWIFQTREAFNQFVNVGWELGADANASAMLQEQGAAVIGAVQVAPGVWLYQLSDSGLSLTLTVKGTKYYKDAGLN